MFSPKSIQLPSEGYRLEEINLPSDLAASLAGQTIEARLYPEQKPFTRKVDYTETPALLDRDGVLWNAWRPAMLRFSDDQGRVWNLPRHWQHSCDIEPSSEIVYQKAKIIETLHLPSEWDLLSINIDSEEAAQAQGRPVRVGVELTPNMPPKVWMVCNPDTPKGTLWRIPHDWRRRRIRLPDSGVLISQGVPEDVAEEYGGTVVSVNYHAGSLCCLADGYRFRDGSGGRYPVRKSDCIVLGYGSACEISA